MYRTRPNASVGYSPSYTQGQGVSLNMAGSTSYAAGQGPGTSTSGSAMPPSVIYMVILIILEMFVFAFIAKHL